MKLSIQEPTLSKMRNTYVVNMHFMHGDADADSVSKVMFKAEADVIDVLTMLNEIGKTDQSLEKEHKKFKKKSQLLALDDWPVDCTYDDYNASLEKVSVVFYDEEGKHRKVKINGKDGLEF